MIYDVKKLMEQSVGYFGHATTKESELACLQVDALLAIAERLEAICDLLKPRVYVANEGDK